MGVLKVAKNTGRNDKLSNYKYGTNSKKIVFKSTLFLAHLHLNLDFNEKHDHVIMITLFSRHCNVI